MKFLLVGATGLVGSQVLQQLLSDDRTDRVVAPSRGPLAAHSKLLAPQVDFNNLPQEAPWWEADAVICTLGTTMADAGSREAFQRVDHDYPMKVAELAHRHGTPTYVLNSAIGADVSSRFFYNKVKGELERDLAKVGFSSLTHVRPGVIGGRRTASRPAERALIFVLGALAPILPRRWHVNPAQRIAQELIASAIHAKPGVHVVKSDALV